VKTVKNLRGKVPRFVHLIECETIPEDFLESIVQFKPTHVLIIDAASMDLKPGSSRLVEPNQIKGYTISTHALPLRIFCEYISKLTKAKIALLSIQPRDTSFGEGLTSELEKTVKRLSSILVGILAKSHIQS
jgi:hydrogenase 3 maturation protease